MSIFAKEFNLKETLTNADIASLAGQMVNEYLLQYPIVETYDNGWEQLFQVFGTDEEFESFPTKARFNVYFNAVGPNEEPVFATVTDGSTIPVYPIKYRAAVRFDNDVIKYNKKAQLEWILQELRRAGMQKIADLHYAALNAGSTAGTNPTAYTPLAVGEGIDATVTAMVNAEYYPTHVVCNISDEPIIRAAINPALVNAILQRDLSGTSVMPLTDRTYALQVVSTRNSSVPAKTAFVVEAKHYCIGVKDNAEGELMMDQDWDKLHDAQNIYAKFRKGCAILDTASVKKIVLP